MPKYVQLAMRRNGLHAVRGWCLNTLRGDPEYEYLLDYARNRRKSP